MISNETDKQQGRAWLDHPDTVAFSIEKGEYKNVNGVQKKNLKTPTSWNTIKKRNIKKGDKIVNILTGKINNVIVLDFDKEAGEKLYDEMAHKFECINDTLIESTPRGYHVYFKYNDIFPKKYLELHENSCLDIISDGCFIISTPSVFCDGKKYELLNDVKPINMCDDLISYLKVLITNKSNVKLKKSKVKSKVVKETPELITQEIDYNCDIEFGKKIMDLIDVQFLDNYIDWLKIISSAKGLNIPKSFTEQISKKVPEKYDPDDWLEKGTYSSCYGSVGSMGLLVNYAKRSNLIGVKELYKKRCAVNFPTSSLQVAQLYLTLWGEALKLNLDKEAFIYDGNIWQPVNKKGDQIIRHLYSNMIPYIKECLTPVENELKILQNEWEIACAEYKIPKSPRQKELETIVKGMKEVDKNLQNRNIDVYYKFIQTEICELYENFVFNNNDEQENNLHFKNGVLMLDKLYTKDFKQYWRKRKFEDLVTYHLPYDYDDNKDEDKIDEIKMLVKKIHYNLEEGTDEVMNENLNGYLSWIAYNLTGNTGLQKMMYHVGYKGSNGKSKSFEILTDVFDKYCVKGVGDFFSKDNGKKHKALDTILNSPCRLLYLEETGKIMAETDLLKNIINGGEMTYEVMYGTNITKKVVCKLNAVANVDPVVDEDDAGMSRRGMIIYYRSQFLQKGTSKSVHAGKFVNGKGKLPIDKKTKIELNLEYKDNFEHGIYCREDDLDKKFKMNVYKNAYIHMLFEYWINFYKKKTIDFPESFTEDYQAAAEEGDVIQSSIISNIETDTGNLAKTDLIERLEELYPKDFKNVNWKVIKDSLTKNTYTYDKNLTCLTEKGKKCRGCIKNCKLTKIEIKIPIEL